MKKLIALLLWLPGILFAAEPAQNPLSQSKQLVIVTTTDWNATTGEMQRFERPSIASSWKKVGKPTSVVLGKHGLGWDLNFKTISDNNPIKQEGDGRTPVGIYSIGPMFGFAEKTNNKNDYFPLTETSVCVDDVKSSFYNQLFDSAKAPKVDWNSAEQMRKVPQYQFGSMVQYNTYPTKPGAGSCIFLHIWKSPTTGTAGCIAMDESNLKNLLSWLNSRKNPVIAILPTPLYAKMKKDWALSIKDQN